MDLFPTLSEIIGASIPTDRKYDGKSILPVFKGDISSIESETPFYYYNCENLQAISYKNWKLHLPRTEEQLPFWERNKEQYTNIEQAILYNITDDISESLDVADEHPEVVQKMVKMAITAREKLGEYNKRGIEQRPTGTLFPDVPVMSHSRDWELLPETIKNITSKKIER